LGKKIILSSLEDEELVKRSQKGNEKAFGVLIDRHAMLVRSSLYKTGMSEADANDVLQQTYIKSWTRIKTFKFKSNFSTWLYRICRNSLYDFSRQKTRRKSKEIPWEDFCLENDKNPLDFLQSSGILFGNDESPSEVLVWKENLNHYGAIIKEVKKSLKPKHRRVIELVVEEELTYAEAAKAMKCPLGTIMSRLYLAKREAQKIIRRKKLL
jgi:RNA polymerase sigma-70 factor (ECF subfamily)